MRSDLASSALDLFRVAYAVEQQVAKANVAAYPRILETQFADGVILVGHSNSGVVALTMPTVAPDLMGGPSPFVRRIGTIDSPLQRLYTGQAELYVARIVAWKHAQGVHVQSLGNAAV